MATRYSNSRIQRLLYLLLVVDGAAAFPSFVVRYADLHRYHFRFPAFLSNSNAAHGVHVHASSSTSKQLFAVAKDKSGSNFFLHKDDDNRASHGSVSGDLGVVLSGTHNHTYYFLKDKVGLSEKAMQKVMRTTNGRRNSLLRFKAPNLGYKIETLRKIMNLTDKEVCTIIEKNPIVLGCSADENLAPSLAFIAETLGLNQTNLRKLITRAPHILGLNTANLQAKIDFFVGDLDLSKAELQKMILRHSKAFTLSVEKMQDTIGYLRDEVGLNNDELKRVVCLNPAVFDFQVPNLNGNVEFLRKSFSFTDEQLRLVIVKYPSLLLYSVEKNLQPKVEYLRKGFGGGDEAVRDAFLYVPALLGYSLENRIRPRLDAILAAGFDPSILKNGIKLKEEDFGGWLQRKIDKREKKQKNDPLW